MAQLIPTMKLTLDTSGAVKNIKKLNDEFKVTSTNLNTVNQSVNGTADAINNTTKSAESLKAQLKAMTQELQGLEPGTAEFNNLANAAGKLKDQINDTNAVINATAGSGLENLAGAMTNVAGVGISAFQGIAGAQAMFGSDSEELMKLMAKLQGAMALGQALKDFGALGDTFTNIKAQLGSLTAGSQLFNKATVAQAVATGTATTAQKIMNTVMKANPIFLIIGAITALVGAFALFSGESESAAEKTERLNDEQLELNKTLEQTAKRVDALNKSYAQYRQEANLTGVLKTQKELLEAEDRLTDILRTRPDDLKTIRSIQGEINSLNIKMIEDEKDARRAAFKEETIVMKSKLEGIYAEQQTIRASDKVDTDAAQSRLTSLFDEAEALRIALELRQDNIVTGKEGLELQNLTLELENQITKAKIDAGNKIADINQKILERELEAIKNLGDASAESYQKAQEKAVEAINRRYKEQVDAAQAELDLIDKNSSRRLEAEKIYSEAVKNFTIERNKSLASLEAQAKKDAIIKLETELNEIRTKLLKAQGIEAVSLLIIQHEKEKELLKLQMEEELDNIELTEVEKLKIKSDYALKTAEMEKAFRDKSLDDSTETVEKQTMKFKEMFKKVGETWTEDWAVIMERIVDFTVNVGMQITDLLGQAFSQLNDQASYAVQEDSRIRTETLDDELANRLITEEQYRRKIDSLEDQKLQKERAIKKKQFNQDKALRITNAIMLGAQAVMAALATVPPASYVMAGINAGLAGAQIAIISSQQFTAARGGVVPGMASKVDSVDAKLAPGEMVINSNSSSMFPTLLSEINKAGGGISLAPDPIVSMMGGRSNNIFTQNETVLTAVVVESQMSSTQKRVKRMEDSSSFS